MKQVGGKRNEAADEDFDGVGTQMGGLVISSASTPTQTHPKTTKRDTCAEL